MAIGSCAVLPGPFLPACPAAPPRLIRAIHELSDPFQSSGILTNASNVYPEENVSLFSGAPLPVVRKAPCSGFWPPLKYRLACPGWSGWCSLDHVSASLALPGTVATVRSLPFPEESAMVCEDVTAVPFAPPASKRQ